MIGETQLYIFRWLLRSSCRRACWNSLLFIYVSYTAISCAKCKSRWCDPTRFLWWELICLLHLQVYRKRAFFFLLKTKESRDWPLYSTLVPHSVLKIMWIKLNVNVTTAQRRLKNSRLQQVLNPWPRNTGVKLQSTKPWSGIFQIEVQNMIHLYIHIISFIDSFNNSTCCFKAQLDKAPSNITRWRGFKLVESLNFWGFCKQLLELRLQLWALLHKCSSKYD